MTHAGGNLVIEASRSYYILMGDMAWILATIRWLNVGEVRFKGGGGGGGVRLLVVCLRGSHDCTAR
jgi:hypothetical protein